MDDDPPRDRTARDHLGPASQTQLNDSPALSRESFGSATSSGTAHLLRRHDGAVLASLSIPEVWGFVAPDPLDLGLDLASLVPPEVVADVAAVWGPPSNDDASAASVSSVVVIVSRSVVQS